MFQLQKMGKENVRRIVDSFEVLNEHKQIKKNDENYLLQCLIVQKHQIEKQIQYLTHKIYSFVDD